MIAHSADALVHRSRRATGADGRPALAEQGRQGLAAAKEHTDRVRADILGNLTDEQCATAESVLQRATGSLLGRGPRARWPARSDHRPDRHSGPRSGRR
ncbi:hypothetical protein ACGF07_30610 [Kitasatospora sp. NPDC048194]|uniref:hypothetical protein n=1 Tax=Kitasatospora sp. NPDC048194 TaxID=3364045 RepID=UPI003721B51F